MFHVDDETDEFLNDMFLQNEEFMLSAAVLNLACENKDNLESEMRMR